MTFEPESLVRCVRRFLPGDDAVRFTPIPTGKFNTSFFVRAGEQDFVLRIAPPRDAVFVFYERNMMRQEPAIHDLLRRETTVPVARIVGYDDSHEIIRNDYLLMDRLPGHPMCDALWVDEDAVLRAVGDALAQVHRLTAPQYGYLGAHAPMTPQPTWRDAFALMWRKLIDDVVFVGHYSQEDAAFLLRLLDKHIRLFDRNVPASLLHMDIWAQNILVAKDGAPLTGIVDWDRALWGDPEIEFAVLDYCGISKPAFWEGYGRPRDTSPEAGLRNLFYLLYEIQKYIVIDQGRNNDPAAARQYRQHVMHLAGRL